MARRPIKKVDRVSVCVPAFPDMPATQTMLCIDGGKYYFSAWLTAPGGKRLAPVSTGKARTAATAMKRAKTAIRRIRGRGKGLGAFPKGFPAGRPPGVPSADRSHCEGIRHSGPNKGTLKKGYKWGQGPCPKKA